MSGISVIKPCHCGFSGEIQGTKGAWLSLTCPQCKRTVEAFTVEGLAKAWNKPKEQSNEQRNP